MGKLSSLYYSTKLFIVVNKNMFLITTQWLQKLISINVKYFMAKLWYVWYVKQGPSLQIGNEMLLRLMSMKYVKNHAKILGFEKEVPNFFKLLLVEICSRANRY